MKSSVLVGVLVAAVFVFLSTTAAASDLPKEVVLFTEVGLTSTIPPGVSKVSGYHSNSPAYRFTYGTKDIISKQQGLDDARRVISKSHDFIVSAYVKVDSKAKYGKNTILSISSKDGQHLYFFLAISSDWQTSQMKLEFSFVDAGNLHTIRAKTPGRVDVTVWHKLSMRVQDSEKLMRFYLDDNMVDVRKFDHSLSSIPLNSQLRLAQAFEIIMEGTGEITNRFIGDLQDVKISLGSSQNKCNTPTTVPAPCACPSKGDSRCFMDGSTYSNGQQWNKDKCNVCQCKDSRVICIHTCPVCKDSGKIYLHGDKWHPSNDSCMDCKCESGKTVCSPPTCAKPHCFKPGYSGQTIVLPRQCCPICKEDQCVASKLEYKTCGCTKTCDNHHSKAPCGGKCTEGCFCPKGKLLGDNGKCISPVDCKCRSDGKTFKMTMNKPSDTPPQLPPRSTSSYSRKRRLYCTNGLYLEINYNGTVKGTMNEHSPLVVMEIVPVGKNLVHIRGVHTGFYLAMSNGEVYTTKTETDECVFQDTLSKQFCDNFTSNKYCTNKLMLGVLRTGAVVAIPASTAAKDTSKYSTQFLTKMATT